MNACQSRVSSSCLTGLSALAGAASGVAEEELFSPATVWLVGCVAAPVVACARMEMEDVSPDIFSVFSLAGGWPIGC